MLTRICWGLAAACVVIMMVYGLQPEFHRKIADFSRWDWVVILLFPCAIFLLYVASRLRRQDRLTSKETFIVASFLATVLALSVVLIYFTSETAQAIVVTGYLASVGWLYTNYVNTVNYRKAHTMNVLLTLRNSSELQKNRANVLAKFPYGRPITVNDLPALKAERASSEAYKNGHPTLESVYFWVNYYEFICVALVRGDLDWTMMDLTSRSHFVNVFNHLEAAIRDASNMPNGTSNPRIYEHYLKVVGDYKRLMERDLKEH